MKYLFPLIFIFSSCASLNKSISYGSIAGAMVGGLSGSVFSPNERSRNKNIALFGAIGALAGGYLGGKIYKEDPRNKKLKPMLDMNRDINQVNFGLDGININANLNPSEKYLSPQINLPKHLEGKVKKQYLIKYKAKERYINKGNKTYYIPPFEVYEHAYNDK